MLHGLPTGWRPLQGKLAAEARYWWERAGDSGADASASAVREACWERWHDVVAPVDRDVLARRLRWAGIDYGRARRAAGPPTHDPHAPLPGWALTVEQIADCVSRGVDGSVRAPAPCDEQEPIPFEHLLEPAVRVARARLRARCERYSSRTGGDPAALLLPDAHRALDRALLQRLSALAAAPLYADLCMTRPYGLTLLGTLDERAGDFAGVGEYGRFVKQMASDGLLGFFGTYPVVARLLATAVDQWVDATADFLERLSADSEEIARRVLGASDGAAGDPCAFRVSGIQTSLSDAHRGGRAVSVLTLAGGQKLVYKPKNLGLEAALSAFLEWCNAGGTREKLRAVWVVDRGDYGWVEHVEHAPCATVDETRRYYRRAGMLLCILHALRATDCHHGNLIASGEHPVVVDAETLLHPTAPAVDATPLSEPGPVARKFFDSVLRTLMLPAWHLTGDGRVAYDVSGLAGRGGEASPHKVPNWRWVNTDVMVVEYQSATLPAEQNVVRLGNRTLEPADFQAEIAAGFEETWHDLARRRDELLAENSPLTAMRELPTRFLFRPTRIYLAVLMNACVPDHLRSGAAFSIELDHLARAFLIGQRRPTVWPILEEELISLGQLDVPYFAGRASSDALELAPGTMLPGYFLRSGYDDAIEVISGLDDEGLRWQLALIEASFQARVARNDARMTHVRGPLPTRHPGRDQAIAEAERLAGELDRRAIRDSRGELNWLGLSVLPQTERVRLELIGEGLYDGRCGIALFLAALHRVIGSPRARELAGEALASVRRLSEALAADPGALAWHPDGPEPAAVGWMIYALLKIDELLDGSEHVEHARALARSITPEAVGRDVSFDVQSGSAGVILGLVSLHGATGDRDALRLAHRCGLHLVEHRVSHRGAPRAWRTMGARPLTGFSHGAAGIAYALLRLHAADGDERFRDTALEAIEYERSVFSPSERSWPDLREAGDDDAGAFADQWCHGAAGIGLARLASRGVMADPSLDAEVDIALQATKRRGLTAVDHVCCGNTGRIEALWAGAHRMQRADWHDASLRLAGQMHARATEAGTYQLFPNLPCEVFNPSFFRGVAGIGYQWLRLADPQLPSVLLWD